VGPGTLGLAEVRRKKVRTGPRGLGDQTEDARVFSERGSKRKQTKRSTTYTRKTVLAFDFHEGVFVNKGGFFYMKHNRNHFMKQNGTCVHEIFLMKSLRREPYTETPEEGFFLYISVQCPP